METNGITDTFGGGLGWLILLFLFLGGNAYGKNSANDFTNQDVYSNQKLDTITSATSQRFFDIQNQLAQCCCDNKLAIADLKFTSCENTNKIIENANANTYKIESLINDQEVARLRERLNNCDTQLAISNQTATLLGQLGTFYPNPPCGYSCSC